MEAGDAIAMAAKKANITEYSIRLMPEFSNSFFEMAGRMNMVKEKITEQKIGPENYPIIKKAESIKNMNGILMYEPFEWTVQ